MIVMADAGSVTADAPELAVDWPSAAPPVVYPVPVSSVPAADAVESVELYRSFIAPAAYAVHVPGAPPVPVGRVELRTFEISGLALPPAMSALRPLELDRLGRYPRDRQRVADHAPLDAVSVVAAEARDGHPGHVGVLDVGPDVLPHLAVGRGGAAPCRVLDQAFLRVVVVLPVLVTAALDAAGDGVQVGELALAGVVVAGLGRVVPVGAGTSRVRGGPAQVTGDREHAPIVGGLVAALTGRESGADSPVFRREELLQRLDQLVTLEPVGQVVSERVELAGDAGQVSVEVAELEVAQELGYALIHAGQRQRTGPGAGQGVPGSADGIVSRWPGARRAHPGSLGMALPDGEAGPRGRCSQWLAGARRPGRATSRSRGIAPAPPGGFR